MRLRAIAALMLLTGCGPERQAAPEPPPSQAVAAAVVARLIETSAQPPLQSSAPSVTAQPRVHVWTPLPEFGLCLRLPPGFVPAEGYAGFEQPERAASLRVARLAVPIAAFTAGITAEGLASQGLRLRHKRELRVDGRWGLLLSAEQRSHGVDMRRWTLMLGDDASTHTLTASFPVEHAAALSDELLEALLSVRFEPTPADSGPVRPQPGPRGQAAPLAVRTPADG